MQGFTVRFNHNDTVQDLLKRLGTGHTQVNLEGARLQHKLCVYMISFCSLGRWRSRRSTIRALVSQLQRVRMRNCDHAEACLLWAGSGKDW